MKNLIFILPVLLLLFGSCVSERTVVCVPAKQSIEIDYPNYDLFNVNLKNSSLKNLEVAVLSKANNTKIKGFGLGKKGNADVLVEAENKLVLQNEADKPVYIRLKVTEEKQAVFNQDETYISFTLKNTSATSIPLIIPSVMNPNLSPYSKSGVSLKIGQKIFFKSNGKKYLLLTVSDSINEGAEIDVPKLLKQRKMELGSR